jgi:hypothetical protein
MNDLNALLFALIPLKCRCGTAITAETPCATIPMKYWNLPSDKQTALHKKYLQKVQRSEYCGRVLADHRAAAIWRERTLSPDKMLREWVEYEVPPLKRICRQLNDGAL